MRTADAAVGNLTLPGELPTGEAVVAGQATVNRAGAAMDIVQGSDRLILNWQTFNIGPQARVDFKQPGPESVALNRVLVSDPSRIYGTLTSNGQVFLVNPTGIIFGKGSSVNVGGLVATTMSISNEDFLAGRTHFERNGSTSSILNEGTLTAANGGYIGLFGAEVTNDGLVSARLGSVMFASGEALTMTMGADNLYSISIDPTAVKTAIENRGMVIADGGKVLMQASTAGDLLGTVMNNGGVIQAKSVEERRSTIVLLSDKMKGRVLVSGTLDASAPDGGNGGFIETSAANVKVADGAVITTAAPYGKRGLWQIDPMDFTISSGNNALSTSGIGAATLSGNLGSGDISIATDASTGGNGDIFVNSAVTWTANKLTLSAHRNIGINANLNGSATASLALEYGQGAVAAGNAGTYTLNNGAKVNLPAGPNFSTRLGSDGTTTLYTVITDLGVAGDTATGSATLQGMANSSNLSGHFVLGSDIDASATLNWNDSGSGVKLGFTTIGGSVAAGVTPLNAFTGVFDGLGHTISNLTIKRVSSTNNNYIGLFGYAQSATLRNVGLTVSGSTPGVYNIEGNQYVGGLVGRLVQSTITNAYSTINVAGTTSVGGLVGMLDASIISNSNSSGKVSVGGTNNSNIGGLAGYSSIGSTIFGNSSSSGAIDGWTSVDGLVGLNEGSISNSSSTSTVTSDTGTQIGGLVGADNGGTISDSFHTTGTVKGWSQVGGLVGYTKNTTITNASSSGSVTVSNIHDSDSGFGGLVGYAYKSSIINSSSTSSVSGSWAVGGLVGMLLQSSVTGSQHTTGDVTANDVFAGSLSTQGVGGLVGWEQESSTIANSSSSGKVTGRSAVGGLAGVVQRLSVVKNSSSTADVSGSSAVSGLAGIVQDDATFISAALSGRRRTAQAST